MGFCPFFCDFAEDFFGCTCTPDPGDVCVAEPVIIPQYAIDAEFIELAVELIDDFIPTPNAVWHSLHNGRVADDDEPWITTLPLDCEWPVRILFYPPNRVNNEFLMYRIDTATNHGKVLGIFYKTVFTPKLKDIVQVWGKELTVNFVDEIRVIKDTIVYIAEFGL